MNRFVAALGKELSLTSEEIADILWLAVQMGELPPSTTSDSIESLDKGKSRSPRRNEPPPKKNPIEPSIPNTSPPPAEIHLADDRSSFGGGLAISVPDARSLREPLELARSLKPLLQRVASGWSNVLDEEATILKLDREQIWMPVLKPNLEAWLDLVLVVDESISMQIWQRTISELQRFLAHYGVFRDVRVYSLVVENNQVYVRPRLGAASEGQSLRNPQELLDPSGRRLILVATDCVSTFWRSGELLPALKLWANSGPIAIMQMLPEWLWGRSALGLASAVRFGSLQAGIPNHQLKATNLSLWDDVDLDLGIKVPVVTLEPEMMKTWAQLVAGKGGIQSPGFVFDPEPMPSIDGERNQVEVASAGSGKERVRRFQMTASPMARQLAMILAAAPTISLPIVRILQERRLRRSQQVHVAEVFLGGLLKPLVAVDAQSNPDLVPYEFMDGARDVLLDSIPTTEVVNVMQEVSQFVAERLGLTLDAFMGVLRNPQEAGDRDVVSQSRPFALVTAQILRKLGGGYTQFAQELEQANWQDPSEIDSKIDCQALEVWNCVRSFSGHKDNVTCVAFSPDGKFIVSSSDDKTIRLWDVQESRELWKHETQRAVYSVVFSPDCQLIAFVDSGKALTIDLQGDGIKGFNSYASGVTSVAFSHDSHLIASAGANGLVEIWSYDGSWVKGITLDRNIIIETITFNAEGDCIVCRDSDGNIYLNYWNTGVTRTVLKAPANLTSFALQPSTGKVATGSEDGMIRVLDTHGLQTYISFVGHENTIYSVTFSPDGKLIASGSRDKTIRLWDLEGTPVGTPLIGHDGGVNCVAFSPDGRILVSCGSDRKIKLWSKYPARQLPFRKLSDFAVCYLLNVANNTNINVLQSISPWKIPFDALIISIGSKGRIGVFGESFDSYLNSITNLQFNFIRHSINSKMQELGLEVIDSKSPLVFPLPSDINRHFYCSDRPILIICVTARENHKANSNLAVSATKAAIEIAAQNGCKNIILHLFGTSKPHGLPIEEVSEAMLRSIDSTLKSFDNNEIEEITIVETSSQTTEAIERIGEMLFGGEEQNDKFLNSDRQDLEVIEESEKTRQAYYREIIERYFDEIGETIISEFVDSGYEFRTYARDGEDTDIDEIYVNEVDSVNISGVVGTIETDELSGICEVSTEIIFSVKFTQLDHESYIKEIHEDSGYPTISGIISNQSVSARVKVYVSFLHDENDELEIDHIDLIIEQPILVDYQDAVYSAPDSSEDSDDFNEDEKDISNSNTLMPLKVFISYCHDSQEHLDRVLNLSDRLRLDGIDCSIDLYENAPPEGWLRWMLNQVESADFVLIVCSEQYDRRFRGNEVYGKGKDATWEGTVIIQELYDSQGQNSKFIPIALNRQDSQFIPAPLRANTIHQLDDEHSYELLYRRLTNQHETPAPMLGQLRKLPARDRHKNSPTSSSLPTNSILQPSIASITQLVENALSDNDLSDLCYDHFPEVYSQFTTGQTKYMRIRSLIEYAERQREAPKLLNEIKRINPNAYREFISTISPLESAVASHLSPVDITEEARELLMAAFESDDNMIFVTVTNQYEHIIANELNFVDRPELLNVYKYALAQLIEKNFIKKLPTTTSERYELASKGYEFCIRHSAQRRGINEVG